MFFTLNSQARFLAFLGFVAAFLGKLIVTILLFPIREPLQPDVVIQLQHPRIPLNEVTVK